MRRGRFHIEILDLQNFSGGDFPSQWTVSGGRGYLSVKSPLLVVNDVNVHDDPKETIGNHVGPFLTGQGSHGSTKIGEHGHMTHVTHIN